jgi:hypothetical protein
VLVSVLRAEHPAASVGHFLNHGGGGAGGLGGRGGGGLGLVAMWIGHSFQASTPFSMRITKCSSLAIGSSQGWEAVRSVIIPAVWYPAGPLSVPFEPLPRPPPQPSP